MGRTRGSRSCVAAPIPDGRTAPIILVFFGWGRLKEGVTVEQARSEIQTIAARLEKTYPETNAGLGAVVKPLLDNILGSYRTNLALLLCAVALVLLIACANLANLFAARGASRSREFAIRAAIGASRARVIRQLLIESFCIALLGGALGYLFAVWGRDALVAFAPTGAPRFEGIGFDARVLGFTFLLAGLTTVLFGLWPAWQVAHGDIQTALQAGSFGSSETKTARRSRDWLVIGEVALTLLLLSAAGLVLKSFAKMQSVALGFEPQRTPHRADRFALHEIRRAAENHQLRQRFARRSASFARRAERRPGRESAHAERLAD